MRLDTLIHIIGIKFNTSTSNMYLLTAPRESKRANIVWSCLFIAQTERCLFARCMMNVKWHFFFLCIHSLFFSFNIQTVVFFSSSSSSSQAVDIIFAHICMYNNYWAVWDYESHCLVTLLLMYRCYFVMFQGQI